MFNGDNTTCSSALLQQVAVERPVNSEEDRGSKLNFHQKNMVEHGDIRVVHRGGSKINSRQPVVTNDSR